MSPTPDQFGKSVIKAGLSTADDLKALWAALAPGERPKDGEAFSKVLVDRQLLTPFQAERLLNGQADSLVLGDYVLLERLGAGGMGEVFKARHREMDRLVAIKLLPPDVTKDDDAIKRFQREVKAAARLSHPNIVTAFDASKKNGRNYLVMEFVEGDDLAALLKKNGPLPVLRAVDYITQAARGLVYAHEQGVIHRDIKPANLLLDASGTVKILDMGLARLEGVSERKNEALTTSGQMMGTVDYMAPEQSMDTRTADARSDVYSLGCTLFRLLTGENIFSEDTMVKTLMAHMQNPIPSLTERCPNAPPELEAVFERMVAKEPAARFQTMREVEQALTDCRPAITRGGFDVTQTFAPVGWTPRPSASPTNPTSNPPAIPDGRGVHPTGVSIQVSKEAKNKRLATEERGGYFSRGGKFPRWLIGLAMLGAIVFAGVIVVVIRDKDGKKIGEHEVPQGGSATVEARDDKDKSKTSSNDPPAKVSQSKSITRPTPSGPAPEMAKAPFDAATAKKHQAAWAKHLGIEIETPNNVGLTMVLIPPGEFLMGSTDEQVEAALKVATEIKADGNAISRIEKAERPQHRVVISQPFLLGATEVTIGQFKKFSATGYVTEAEKAAAAEKAKPTVDPSKPPPKPIPTYLSPGYVVTDDSPAALITWNDAVAYCDWLSGQEKMPYRLPTEAEWEYACRAGTTTQYSFGDEHAQLGNYAWFNQNAGGRSHPVGTKSPNPFGLFDMHGNLHKWCGDYWDEKWYEKSSPNDPFGPSANSSRVIRGGHWAYNASYCRSACRNTSSPSYRHAYDGFRVVCRW